MAWTTPKDWSVAEVVTASALNTHLRDNMNEVFRAIDRSNVVVDIANNATESSLEDGAAHTALTGWTIPANVMGASRGIRVTITGDALYNNSDSDNCVARLYVANTLLATISDMFGPGSPSAAREGWRIVAEVWNLAANSQIATINYSNNARLLNTIVTSVTLGTADTTASWLLDITGDWSAASANNSLRRRHCVLELI